MLEKDLFGYLKLNEYCTESLYNNNHSSKQSLVEGLQKQSNQLVCFITTGSKVSKNTALKETLDVKVSIYLLNLYFSTLLV